MCECLDWILVTFVPYVNLNSGMLLKLNEKDQYCMKSKENFWICVLRIKVYDVFVNCQWISREHSAYYF